jgi:hypothetical protein
MAGSHDDSGESSEEDLRAACETEPRKNDKKRSRSDEAPPPPPPPPPAPSQEEHRATSSADDGLAYARDIVGKRMREILAMNEKSVPSTELCKNTPASI